MRHLKLIAAALAVALAVFALSACVGFIFPIPLPSETTTQYTDHNERR